jgi:predicted alpha/beta superfamily hydrolase
MLQPVCLPNTESLVLESSAGRAYRILIGAPTDAAPANGFPVIYLLDAHTCFGSVLESVRLRCRRPDATRVGPAVIVGITQSADGSRLSTERTHDFTLGPCADLPDREAAGGHVDGTPGGALVFMDFLQTVVKPAISDRFPVCKDAETLFGHSLGGYFVLQALVSEPASYANFVAVSPSIWWGREQLFDAAARAFGRREATPPSSPSVFLYTGEYEEALAPWQFGKEGNEQVLLRRQQRAMIQNAESFTRHLRSASESKVRATHQCFPGEDHASVLSVAINHALREVLAPH